MLIWRKKSSFFRKNRDRIFDDFSTLWMVNFKAMISNLLIALFLNCSKKCTIHCTTLEHWHSKHLIQSDASTTTGCPRPEFTERKGYNSETKHFWPHIGKDQMCFRSKQFFYIYQLFAYKKHMNAEKTTTFNHASLVLW